MPNLRIRIGATLDADLGAVVFRPLVDAAKAARAQVRKELDGIGDDVRTASRRVGGGRGSSRAGAAGEASPAGAGEYRKNAPDAAVREGTSKLKRAHQEQEGEEKRHHTAMERLAQEASDREKRRMSERRVERISGNTVRAFSGVVRRGADVASDIARGAGVDFSLGNAVKDRFELEKRATDLSNASYMPGDKGDAGVRQDPRQLMREVQDAANVSGLDTAKAMEGLQSFVGKTGDLATGRAVLKDMGVLARATGGELSDIVSAAGDVSANLGNVGEKFATSEQKARAVAAVMAAMAAQGKVGAVEMKDLASQMAKLAASAPQFAGPVEQSMAAMGALAQMARAKGGAASATQATTSVQGFVSTFDKAARVKEFKAAGVQIRDSNNMLLDPEEIIVNSLKATKGDPGKMNKLFMDAGAKRVTRGFQNIYNQAEGQQKGSGEAAVRAEFAKLKGASMKTSERDDSFKTSMATGEAQAQVLKNQFSKQLGDAVEQVAPRLMELAPITANAVQALGNLVGWAANNPWQAATAAFGVSMAKSLGEEGMRVVTSKLMAGAANALTPQGFSMGALQKGSGAATAMSTVGAALAITAAAVTITEVGMLAIDKVMEQQKTGKDAVFGDDMNAVAAASGLRMAQQQYDQSVAAGAPSPEAAAKLEAAKQEAEQAQARLMQRVEQGKQVQQGEGTGFTAASLNSLFGTDWFGGGQNLVQREASQESAAQMKQLSSDLTALSAALKNTIKVEVTNQPGPGAPGVNPAGRAGPGQ